MWILHIVRKFMGYNVNKYLIGQFLSSRKVDIKTCNMFFQINPLKLENPS